MPGWMEGRGGQPKGYCHRQMLDAVRYLVAGGTTWRAMPADFPPWDRVCALSPQLFDADHRPIYFREEDHLTDSGDLITFQDH
ncbi:transposase [Actinacidiphila paucisporea]|nr:transposase [Actinacidiphila paucisporea]